MRSIVYDIYSFQSTTIKDAVKEYRMLMFELKSLASHIIGNCKIRLDVGAYGFNVQGRVKETDKLRIHLIVQGKDTSALEDALGANIASFPLFHNFEKHVFGQKTLNRHSKKMLDKMSKHQLMINCKHNLQNQVQSVSFFPISPF